MRQEPGLRLPLVVLLLSLSAAALGQAMDTHASGFPDDTLITAPAERRAFRLWFASIAEAQYTAPSPAWEHRDCSGLLRFARSEEHTSELQSRGHLVCRLLLEKKKQQQA